MKRGQRPASTQETKHYKPNKEEQTSRAIVRQILGEAYVNDYAVRRISWANVPKNIRKAHVPGLLKKYRLNEAYLTDEDICLKVDGKDLL